MFLPESSLGPSDRSLRDPPRRCHQSWDSRSSLWLQTPRISFAPLWLCLLFSDSWHTRLGSLAVVLSPTQFPWWEPRALLEFWRLIVPPSALGPWAACPVSLVLLPSPPFWAALLSVCSLGTTLVLRVTTPFSSLALILRLESTLWC